ncbi:MAG: AmmeMemoRadiSam system protein B [Syntrophorhabdales bacterium]
MIREPAASGMFYPANPKALAHDIELYLEQASPAEIKGEIKGLIAPHAGYMYSGAVAAWGYKVLLKRTYDTVIIIAPSHRSHFEGVALQEQGGYRMPLGIVKIDEEFASELLKSSGVIQPNFHAHQGEHSLEVQLPFLQVVLKEFRMVPLIMGDQDAALCEALASALFQVMQESEKQFLVVGSTDLSHYYPYSHALELDGRVARNLNNFNVKEFVRDLAADKCEACGAGPMITTMIVSQKLGANGSKVLKYANSGDVSGDKASVVGYISVVFYKMGNGRGD